MSSIAADYGFVNWKTLYDHPANAALKKLRPNPNALVPGDRVAIPEQIPMSGQHALGQWHEIRIKTAPTTLKVQFLGRDGKPLANAPYTFEIGSELREGTTDGSGVLKEKADPTLSSARVTLNPNTDDERVYNLQLGALDDASTVSGAQARLKNLDYYTGPIDGRLDDETRFALRLFQKDNGLEETARLDDDTLNALNKTHDSVT
ncbi:MAG TPA: peptidoglycan-binding domain-containing protein [Polyangiaceae bacterium]